MREISTRLCDSAPQMTRATRRSVVPDHPHGDELTFFDVRLVGPGLDARTGVESIAGDHGSLPDLAERRGDVTVFNDARLSDFVRDLSGGRLGPGLAPGAPCPTS